MEVCYKNECLVFISIETFTLLSTKNLIPFNSLSLSVQSFHHKNGLLYLSPCGLRGSLQTSIHALHSYSIFIWV